MKVKLSEKVISIPPYISTSWSNIKSLYIDDDKALIFNLVDGAKVHIPGLSEDVIQAIFDMHVKVVEQRLEGGEKEPQDNGVQDMLSKMSDSSGGGVAFPMQFEMNDLDGLGSMMQHNPAQSDSPDLPDEVLKKVAAIAEVVGKDEMMAVPQPVQGCNCFYCQITRAIHKGVDDLVEEDEDAFDEVTDDDLKFREWDIKQIGENLYEVVNPLDESERYNVFLGEPLGCTCGEKNCEHVRAVLQS